MDYSPKEFFLHPGERKVNSSFIHIIHVAVTMLIFSACTILLVIPIIFVTLFMLGSFQLKTMESQHQSSILLSKIHPHLQRPDQITSLPITLQYSALSVNIPDDRNSKERTFSTKFHKSVQHGGKQR